MDKFIDLINEKLKDYENTIMDLTLKDVINYALFPGGKRIRPLLLLSILADLDLDIKLGIYQAVAIEMIHTYSLIHDDLPSMDDDDYRRGLPSVHKKYGEALAILAGDALLTDAFAIALKGEIAPETKIKIIESFSKYCGSAGMVKGQVADVLSAAERINLSTVEEIYLRKTKDLFTLAAVSAAYLGNVDSDVFTSLKEFTHYFGLAFQFKDDLEDINVQPNGRGDLAGNKATFPILIGTKATEDILAEYKEKALAIIKNTLGDKITYQLVMRTL